MLCFVTQNKFVFVLFLESSDRLELLGINEFLVASKFLFNVSQATKGLIPLGAFNNLLFFRFVFYVLSILAEKRTSKNDQLLVGTCYKSG